MQGWWLANYYEVFGLPFVISWVVWIVVSIVLHELGHGWMAIRCGDDTPRYLGHMTLNPFVHIPGMAWLLFVFLGMTYGLMPVNPHNFNGRNDEAKVAFAGPLVNIIQFVACCIVCALWMAFASGVGDPLYTNVGQFFLVGAAINAFGFVFNLVPVPPLDGSRIAMHFVPPYRRFLDSGSAGIVTFVAMGLLFFVGSQFVWGAAFALAHSGIGLVADGLSLLGGTGVGGGGRGP